VGLKSKEKRWFYLTLGEEDAVPVREKMSLQLAETENLNSLALDFSQVL